MTKQECLKAIRKVMSEIRELIAEEKRHSTLLKREMKKLKGKN